MRFWAGTVWVQEKAVRSLGPHACQRPSLRGSLNGAILGLLRLGLRQQVLHLPLHPQRVALNGSSRIEHAAGARVKMCELCPLSHNNLKFQV